MEAVKRVETTGEPVAKVAAGLGVNENTLHGWLKRYAQRLQPSFLCRLPNGAVLTVKYNSVVPCLQKQQWPP